MRRQTRLMKMLPGSTPPLWAQPRINNVHSLHALGKMDEAMKYL
jgi:hypothetical protein